ncbi:MAG TPA: hypothetical protein VF484_00780, partial [Candidatus Limnocylindrales bacterium]
MSSRGAWHPWAVQPPDPDPEPDPDPDVDVGFGVSLGRGVCDSFGVPEGLGVCVSPLDGVGPPPSPPSVWL